MSSEFIPELLGRYPGVEYALEGASLEEQEFRRRIVLAAIASLFLIYGLIAIPLKSYSQPLVIMSVIPFGLIGAAIGHMLLGLSFSMFSLFGLIALAGVVVNKDDHTGEAQAFAEKVGIPVLASIPADDDIRRKSAKYEIVGRPGSPWASLFEELATNVAAAPPLGPKPLEQDELLGLFKGDAVGRDVVLEPATLETGAVVRVPLFIQTGEKIKVDTRTGAYVSRVKDE